MAHVERLRREAERVDLMLKFARGAAAAVYGKEGIDLMNDTVREFVDRVTGGGTTEPPEAPAPDAYWGVLRAEYAENERLNAGYDERMAAHAVVVYVPPPVGSFVQPGQP